MDEAEAGALHQGYAGAQCSQQEKPRSLLDGFIQVEVREIEVVSLAHGEVEELIVPLHRKREEEVHRQEGDGEEAVGKKGRVEVLAEGESQLVLKDEQSS
jgi:hypothetical protein